MINDQTDYSAAALIDVDHDGRLDIVAVGGASPYTEGAWVPVAIEVLADQVTVWYDGEEVLSSELAVDTGDAVGFSAGTGAYTAEHSVRNIAFEML